MVQIRFDAKLSTRSAKGAFSPDTIAAVYVTNRDDCSYKLVPVAPDGTMSVDYDMRSLKEGVKLTDRIKFHYYFRDNKDQFLKPVCAGHMKMVDLADHAKDGHDFIVRSNFNTNKVCMTILPNAEHSKAMHLDLLQAYQANQIVPSVLSESAKHAETIQILNQCIQEGLGKHTNVTSDNGGHMFQSVMTAHIMEKESTLYSLYHIDFNDGHTVPPWLCTYMLTETLNHNAVTIEQVHSMSNKQLTDFVASYAQGPMRSATATPYTPDVTLNEDPAMYACKRSVLSEVFKRPYSHPYQLLQSEAHGNLMTDDCEGLVLMVRNLTNHLSFMYETHAEDFKQSENYVRYNNLMKAYFPRDLFANMSPQYQSKLMSMALFLGEKIKNKVIDCKVTLVSANGASYDTHQREIQAHACATMEGPEHTVMLEGTSCVADDQDSQRVWIRGQSMTLADVANSLSHSDAFNTFMESQYKTKIAMHLTHDHSSFYRTAFCQNDALLGSQIGHRPLMFGVDMEYLSDEAVKVHMPVTGKILKEGDYDRLKEYIKARSCEIHPPLVDHNELRERLRWLPIHPFKGCKELDPTRTYTTCLVHVLSDADHPADKLLSRAIAEAEAFNSKPNNLKLGVMRAFPSMDGISKVFHMYTDKTEDLLGRLSTPGG